MQNIIDDIEQTEKRSAEIISESEIEERRLIRIAICVVASAVIAIIILILCF